MPQDQDDIKGADAMKQAPTPGPLSGDDVKLLVKGDLVRGPDGRIHRFDEWGDGGFLTFIDNLHEGCLATRCSFVDRPGATEEVNASTNAGREAIWKVVHEVWQLLDDAETDSAGIATPDQQRWQAVSEAMDALEALVPESEGPFWGGYPVNYLWPEGAAK